MKAYLNFTRFQILLYYLASFIGLAPFSMKNNILRPVGSLRKAYAVILAILGSLWVYFVLFNYRKQGIEVSSVNHFGSAMMVILSIVNLWATLLVFAFKSNKMIDILNQMTAIKDELRKLGIEDSWKKCCKSFYARIIATNLVILLCNMIVNSANYHHNRDHYSALVALYWIGNAMRTIHIHSALLIFVETMICIRGLFESLNNKLQGTADANSHFLSFDEEQNSSVLSVDIGLADQVAHRITTGSDSIQLSVEEVEKIGKIHGELCDLVEFTTHFHTIPLLVAIVRNFGYMLLSWYSLYTHVFISNDVFKTTEAIIPWILRLVGRTTTTVLELILIAHASTLVSKVGNATKAILHEVWSKYHPEELRNELCKFSLQLLHKPVAVTVFGFFDLGYSHIYKIFWTLVAYFIVMIQLDSSQRNPDTQATSEEMGYTAQG